MLQVEGVLCVRIELISCRDKEVLDSFNPELLSAPPSDPSLIYACSLQVGSMPPLVYADQKKEKKSQFT